MPPRRNRPVDIIIQTKRILSRKLTNDIFEMSKKLNTYYECCICQENICCDKCILILNCECGCKMHARCYMDYDSEICPVCRN